MARIVVVLEMALALLIFAALPGLAGTAAGAPAARTAGPYVPEQRARP